MGLDHQSLGPVRCSRSTPSHTDHTPPRAAENPLRSSHNLPSRIHNLAYAPASSRLLVSMTRRNIHVYQVPELAASTDIAVAEEQGQGLKAEQARESALKFLTRSVACMIDGKGEFIGSGV
jgi:cell cycle arrest protein BUB3